MSEVMQSSYIIDFKDFNFECYHLKYDVDSTFFTQYEGCEILGGDCSVEIDLDRSESMLVIDVDITGSVSVECDRCLEPCDVELDYYGQLVVKFTDEQELLEGESDGEIMWLPTATTQVDLKQYIYESIILSLPYQRVHAEGECDAEMIERFKLVSSEEFELIEKRSEEGESESMPEGELAKLAAVKAQLEGK